MNKENGERIWTKDGKLYTENLLPGETVYGEEIVSEENQELREWKARRSKLGAAIMKGMPTGFLKKNTKVLYLGAASGTTLSHVSDICVKGMVFGVEYSHRVVPQLLKNVSKRKNVSPVLGDARIPEDYSGIVDDVDVVFQDVAQQDQFKIFKKNCDKFLKPGGIGVLATKARSVSSSSDPSEVFEKYRDDLQKSFNIIWEDDLTPFEKDHMIFMVEKKD